MAGEQTRRSGRFLASAGLLSVLFFMAGSVIPGLVGGDALPITTPYSASADILRYYQADTQARTLANGFLLAISGFLLIGFAAGLSRYLRPSAGQASPLPDLILAAAIAAGLLLVMSSLFSWELTRPDTMTQLSLIRAMQDLTYLSGGPTHVVALAPLVGASSWLFWTRRLLPRWIAGLGLVIALLCGLALIALLWTPASLFIPLGRFGTFIWIICLSVGLWRTPLADRQPDLARPATV